MKTPFETLQKHLSIEDTKEFRDKHLPEILDAMEAYAKEYHASQSHAVAEVKGLPTDEEKNTFVNELANKYDKDNTSNRILIIGSIEKFWHWLQTKDQKTPPTISSLKSENERLKAELQGKEDRAVEFAEWLVKNKWYMDSSNSWLTPREAYAQSICHGTKGVATVALYQIFLKETSSNGEGKE